MQGKKSFILYTDLIHTAKKLTREQRGDLLMTILEYVNDENPVIDDILIDLVFEPIKQGLKRDLDKWRVFTEKQKLNGSKGGRPKKDEEKPKEPKPFLENPKKPMNVSVNVNDNVNVKTKVLSNIADEEKSSASLYKKCIEVYNQFIIDRTTVKAKIDGIAGKAMKKIIAYLQQNAKEKSDAGVIAAFTYLLKNYDKWDNFHQGQLKLNQIESNLINILNAIRNGKKESKSDEQSRIIADLKERGILKNN